MHKVVILASGKLGLLVLEEVIQSCEVVAVLTDHGSAAIAVFCAKTGIPVFKGNPRGGRTASFIRGISCDILISVNYLYLVERDLIDLPGLYAINLHGSLLPKYRGRTPHVWAIINGETETGITAHLMDEEVDNGMILKQYKIAISEADTGGDILERFNAVYPQMVKELLEDIAGDALRPQLQDNSKATYFGKRTPEDGQIVWDWFRQRIRNWVRAQARPYPGAFCFYNGSKVVIHHAEYSEMGFDAQMDNGRILAVRDQDLFVKTPNGVLLLSDIECAPDLVFEKGEILK